MQRSFSWQLNQEGAIFFFILVNVTYTLSCPNIIYLSIDFIFSDFITVTLDTMCINDIIGSLAASQHKHHKGIKSQNQEVAQKGWFAFMLWHNFWFWKTSLTLRNQIWHFETCWGKRIEQFYSQPINFFLLKVKFSQVMKMWKKCAEKLLKFCKISAEIIKEKALIPLILKFSEMLKNKLNQIFVLCMKRAEIYWNV